MNNTTDEECFQDYNKNVYQVRDEKTRRYLISICRDLLSKPKTKKRETRDGIYKISSPWPQVPTLFFLIF